jgi:hypothetical protein
MLIGTEHEYSINSPDLSPRPESDRILAELAGTGSSQAPFGSVQLSKELQKTVIEVVPDHPAPTVRELEEMVSRGTERFSRKFGDRYRLLGLGMHPALRLSETAVWDQEEQAPFPPPLPCGSQRRLTVRRGCPIGIHGQPAPLLPGEPAADPRHL